MLENLLALYTPLELGLVSVMAVSFLIFLYYYLYLFQRTVRHKHSKKIQKIGEIYADPISIVVVIKDETDYIDNTLPLLLSQEYDNDYEVVVVNDTPDLEQTIDSLKELEERYDNLYVTTIKKDRSFKHTHKLALTIGIKAAKFDNILITEPKSAPISNEWLNYMAYGFTNKKSLVTGYPCISHTPGFTNRFARTVNIVSSLLSLSRALGGKPYKLSGCNMGYNAELFFNSKGFNRYLRLNSGENDLFIQQIRKSADTNVILNPKAVTVINTEGWNFRNWYNCRKFETYTFRYYPASVKFYIRTETYGKLFFWLSTLTLLILQTPIFWIAAAALILIKIVTIVLTLKKLSSRTGEKIPYITYLLYDIFAPFDQLILSLSRNISPSKDLWL